jgi:hypothetical protein
LLKKVGRLLDEDSPFPAVLVFDYQRIEQKITAPWIPLLADRMYDFVGGTDNV